MTTHPSLKSGQPVEIHREDGSTLVLDPD